MAQAFKNDSNGLFLQIDNEGKLYNYSTTPQPEYEEVTSKKGKVGYRRYFSRTDSGKISHISIKPVDFGNGPVDMFMIGVRSETGTDFIKFPLRHSGSERLNDYTKHMARLLKEVDYTQNYTISPSTRKNDRGYLYREFYFNQMDVEGNPFIRTTLNFGEGSPIPKMEKKQAAGKEISDFTAQDNYLYEVLMAEIARFEAFQAANKNSTSSDTPAPAPAPAPDNSAAVVVEDDDALPF